MVLNRVCDLRMEKNPLEMMEILQPLPGEKEILKNI